jgi:dTDP-4-dehydrorhamnose reductase
MPTAISRNASLTEPRNKPVVWVTGAGGLIGNALLHAPNAPRDHQLVGLTRSELDLLDFAALERRFRADSPALVIHCAALSTAAACAKHPELARQVNVEITRMLTELCAPGRLIMLSTDLVFDGRQGNYTEADAVNPLNLYAETKAEAERVVLSCPRNIVIRTSLNAGTSPTGDRSFAEQTNAAWRRGETLKLFIDEYRNPIGADVTARALWELALAGQGSDPALNKVGRDTPCAPSSGMSPSGAHGVTRPTLNELSGIFHVAGSERLNRLQIGQQLAAQWPELNCRMEPASLRDFPGPPRAADCSLNCAKAQSFLSFALPRFSDWLKVTRP